MSKLAYLISNSGSISIYKDGVSYTVNKDHLNYEQIRSSLREKNYEGLEDLINVRKSIETKFGGVVIKDEKVFYKDRELHGVLVEKIVDTIRNGDNAENLVNFLNNLMENPSKRSVDCLFEFIGRYQFTIDEDGYFIAYKSVRSDYFDWHTGTILNTVGSTISLDRNEISDDPDHACHFGLHVGAFEYANNFHSGDNQVILVVRVNPKNVVCVPRDCSWQKIRVCEYEVIAEYKGDENE